MIASKKAQWIELVNQQRTKLVNQQRKKLIFESINILNEINWNKIGRMGHLAKEFCQMTHSSNFLSWSNTGHSLQHLAGLLKTSDTTSITPFKQGLRSTLGKGPAPYPIVPTKEMGARPPPEVSSGPIKKGWTSISPRYRIRNKISLELAVHSWTSKTEHNLACLVDIHFAYVKDNKTFIYDVKRYPPRPGGIKAADFKLVLAMSQMHVQWVG